MALLCRCLLCILNTLKWRTREQILFSIISLIESGITKQRQGNIAYIVIKYIDASNPLHMNEHTHIHTSISSENHFKTRHY